MKPNQNLLPVLVFMAVAAIARIIPHMPNFTPVEGLTLFGAAYMTRKVWAAFLPILLLYLTDLIINNTVMRPFFTEHDGFIWFSKYMMYTWGSMICIAALGTFLLRKITMPRLIAATLGSSVVFFIISNFGVWLHATSVYTKDFQGLMTCYTAALPFFRTSLLSTCLFTFLLFGSFTLFSRFFLEKTPATDQQH